MMTQPMEQLDDDNNNNNNGVKKLKTHPINIMALLYLWGLSMAGAIYLMYPLYTILMIFSIPFCNRIMSLLTMVWFNTSNFVMKYIVGVKVLIYSEKIKRDNDSCLILMNHVGNLDWLHFYRVIVKLFNPESYRIVLKDALSWIPGAGAAMEFTNFLFITRKFEQDRDNIDKYINYHKKNNLPIQLLIFCEGTFMNPNSKRTSDRYATKHGLPQYNHVLHPRTTGFKRMVSQAVSSSSSSSSSSPKNNNNNNKLFRHIYDITMGYKGFPSSIDVETIKGNMGNEFHFLVEKFDINEIPTDDDDQLEQWLIERWKVKEQSLCYFNAHGHFQQVRANSELIVHRSNCFSVFAFVQSILLTVVMAMGLIISITNYYGGVYTVIVIVTLALFHRYNVQFNLYNKFDV